MRQLRWFINRIGKRVYRDNSCSCHHCVKTEQVGLIIIDEYQARYMFDCQNAFAYDAKKDVLNYRDKK
jgi:hypothetical protein